MLKMLAKVVLSGTKLLLATMIMLSLFLIILPACTAQKGESSQLKVAVLPYIGYSTLYIPEVEGYYTEQGLEVELVKFPTVSQAIPLLAQGELDVAMGESAGVINGVANDMNLRIVGGGSYFSSDCEAVSLMVRRDLYENGILDALAEIKGKKVATGSKSATAGFMLSKILEKGGLILDDVELVQLRPSDMAAAFENKAIDAAVVGSPSNQLIKNLGYAVTLESAEKVLPAFQQGFVMFGPTLLNGNLDVGKKFMVAYLQGCRQYSQGKTKRNVEILQEYTGMNEEMLRQSCWYPFYPDGKIKVEDIMSFQDWAYDNDFVDEKVTAEQIIDTRFVEYANEVLGPTQ